MIDVGAAEISGVPDKTPEELNDKPGGRVEFVEKVYGGFPPVATKAYEYGTSTCAEGLNAETDRSEGLSAFTTKVKFLRRDLLGEDESLTRTLKLAVVGDGGVPDKTPVPESSVMPLGNLPLATSHIYGTNPPCAVKTMLAGDPAGIGVIVLFVRIEGVVCASAGIDNKTIKKACNPEKQTFGRE